MRMDEYDAEQRRRYIDGHPRPDELFEQYHQDRYSSANAAPSSRFLVYGLIAVALFWAGAAAWWLL